MLYYKSWQIGGSKNFDSIAVISAKLLLRHSCYSGIEVKLPGKLCTSVDSVDRCLKKITWCLGGID